MKVVIGSDHAGFDLKKSVTEWLKNQGLEVEDLGCNSADSCDYPDFAHPVSDKVEKEGIQGMLICGSGNGIAITANKHKGVRAAICWNEELAELARLHNDANILVIPARFIALDEAERTVKKFFTTAFEGGRHLNRVNKIDIK